MDALATEKACLRCGETKPLEAFHKHGTGRYGRHPHCSACRTKTKREEYQRWGEHEWQMHRNRVVRSRYGLDAHMLRELYEMQEGCCAICGEWKEFPTTGAKGRKQGTGLVIDHDHSLDRVRGLLCWDCNVGLGKFRDSPRALIKALAYLTERGESDGH